jgi:glutamate racemase
MNRAYPAIREAAREAARPRVVPVVQIDEPMIERAVQAGARILAVATHGPTVENTKALLLETAERAARKMGVEYATVERAFDLLGEGDVRGHNEEVAHVIRRETRRGRFDVVVLAQLSMSAFIFSYPDRIAAFGLPVLTSGEEGFQKVCEVLRQQPPAYPAGDPGTLQPT